jgi:ABC-type glycerol-3-phosphate transport system substrate-binding protein
MNKRGISYRVVAIFLMVIVLVFTTGCTKGGDPAAQEAYKSVNLVYWSVWNDEDMMRDLISAYKKIRPNVSIEYRKKIYETYEQELLEAMAEDRGPDVFSIHNTWVSQYKNRILPLPTSTRVPVRYQAGTIKKEEVTEFKTTKSITPFGVQQTYLDVVGEDVIREINVGTDKEVNIQNKVLALPLATDNLVMFYNKDLLNASGILEPPTNWSDFTEHVKRITRIDSETGDILISGTALGTSDNIPRDFDILSVLMMQNRAEMTNSNGYATFAENISGVAQNPAVGALDFYVQFASPLFQTYSWNSKMPDAFTAFRDGKVGYFFGYTYHRDLLKSTAPKLNFAIAPMPQVGQQQKANYASYWVETVSKKTDNDDYAWDFVQFITDEENVTAYLEKTKKPTALRSTKIVNTQLEDPEIIVFAEQIFTAKSWYRGYDSVTAENAFAQMIAGALLGEEKINRVIDQAVSKINRTITD